VPDRFCEAPGDVDERDLCAALLARRSKFYETSDNRASPPPINGTGRAWTATGGPVCEPGVREGALRSTVTGGRSREGTEGTKAAFTTVEPKGMSS
jgi:hypothetical protein